MSLYYLILWNQVDILQKHFKKDYVHVRLWTKFYRMHPSTCNLEIKWTIAQYQWGDKTLYLKTVKCSGEPKKMLALHCNAWDSLLFTMPQWLYLFRLKSTIWTGQI